jgi:cell division protein ZapA
MDDNIMRINLLVDNEKYPLNIPRDQEEYYREAAKQINYKLNRYRSRFPKFDSNKHWAMTAVELAYEVVRLQDSTDVEPYKDKLKELTDLMEKYIK